MPRERAKSNVSKTWRSTAIRAMKQQKFQDDTGVSVSASHEELLEAWAYQMYEWGKQVRTDIIRLEGAMGFQSGDPGDPPEPPWEFG